MTHEYDQECDLTFQTFKVWATHPRLRRGKKCRRLSESTIQLGRKYLEWYFGLCKEPDRALNDSILDELRQQFAVTCRRQSHIKDTPGQGMD